MKHILVFALFFFMYHSFNLSAQNKRDYQWIIGGNSGGGGILLDFNHSPINISYQQTGLFMEGSNTSMSDEYGNLLFSSNGCKIINSKSEVMENGDVINPGIIQEAYCSTTSGSPLRQGVTAIPSPDGKKYIRFNGWNGLNIFDFDAATGGLSNPIHVDFSNDTINYIAGVAVSPNSRYLYLCARKNIYQFDLQAPDIESSKIKIATWDGYQNPYSTLFYLAALAPDGKIYISNTSSTYNLHVINKPNCPGVSCELVQHGIVLPSYNFATIPNLPHYNILNTSYDCDTSISTEVANAEDRVLFFPNPATDQLHIIGLEGNAVISITDISGKTVFLHKGDGHSNAKETIDISSLNPGFYFVSVQQNKLVQQAKIVKQ